MKKKSIRTVATAAVLLGLISGCNGATVSGTHGSIDVGYREVRIAVADRPQAHVLRDGELLIGKTPVKLTDAQRELSRQYYRAVIAVTAAGEATGKAGGHLARKVIGSLFSALWHDDSTIIDRTAHAQSARLKASANALCARMIQLKAVQDRLAATEPAFAPYTVLRKSEIDDCHSNAKHIRVEIPSH